LQTQVAEDIKSERLTELQDLINAQQIAFNQSMVGQTMEVLFEREGKIPGQVVGKTAYMQSVTLNGDSSLFGNLLSVRISNGYGNSLSGERI
jgi:tRNA-2-methylthio-N6-dimethylallyladenosine synthase